ncbi:MAG: NYN domain-containing protein [Dehalococcoidia bacterium]|nr:NYN domain-containing protein [Dehalococcoidia bacterium]
MDKVMVFIDGMNTRCRLEECRWVEDFDVLHLAQRLTGNRALSGVFYYIPTPNRQQLGDEGYSRARRYIDTTDKQPLVKVKKGYMVNRNGVWEEKMVDVLIASDMVFFAARNEYDTAILVTADNDLVPAIQRVRNLNRKVELLVFTRAKPKVGNLRQASSISRRARESYFKPIFKREAT